VLCRCSRRVTCGSKGVRFAVHGHVGGEGSAESRASFVSLEVVPCDVQQSTMSFVSCANFPISRVEKRHCSSVVQERLAFLLYTHE
jgi:hypothetical protein